MRLGITIALVALLLFGCAANTVQESKVVASNELQDNTLLPEDTLDLNQTQLVDEIQNDLDGIDW